MRRTQLLRVGLVLLGAPQLVIGVWARVAPRSWYDDFPGSGLHWISATGPFNRHLVEDYGSSLLAFAVLALWAAFRPNRSLVTMALVVWEVGAVPHFLAHISEHGTLSDADYWRVFLTVGFTAVFPLVLLWLNLSGGGRESNPPDGVRPSHPL
jgi:hypothetical protein